MHLLFVIPKISEIFLGEIGNLASPWKSWKFWNRDYQKHLRKARRVFYGLGAATVAAGIDPCHKVTIVDENHEELPPLENFDLVALSGQLIQTERMLTLVRMCKEKGIYVIIGGTQATLYEHEFFNDGVTIVVGEGEPLISHILQDFESGSCSPVYHSSNISSSATYSSPIPRYDLLAKNRYGLVGVQTTRGCPYRCDYCNVSYILGNQYRHKPIDQVIEEVTLVKRYWPDAVVFFYDDNLFADTEYAFNLFSAIEKNVYLGYYGGHADLTLHHNKELMRLMNAVGNPTCAFGFETLAAKNRESIANPVKTDMIGAYPEIVTTLKKNGIGITGSFMFGFKNDGATEIRNTLEFVRDFGINAFFTIYSVTPLSPLFHRLSKEYQNEYGELPPSGFAGTKVLNRYMHSKNGTDIGLLEKLIIENMHIVYSDEINFARLEGLAVTRYYIMSGML